MIAPTRDAPVPAKLPAPPQLAAAGRVLHALKAAPTAKWARRGAWTGGDHHARAVSSEDLAAMDFDELQARLAQNEARELRMIKKATKGDGGRWGGIGADGDDAGFVEIAQRFFRHVRNIAGDFFLSQLSVASHNLIFFNMNRRKHIVAHNPFRNQN